MSKSIIKTRDEKTLVMCFLSKQETVSEATDCFLDWCQNQGVRDVIIGNTQIVLAETLNNIVEHAYNHRRDGKIQCTISRSAKGFDIYIIDDGKPLGNIPQPSGMDYKDISFVDLPEGGFGWFLIQSLTDHIEHEYRECSNLLKLSIYSTNLLNK